MKKTIILTGFLIFSYINSIAQEYYKSILPIEDSIYIYFHPRNPKYSYYELGSINENKGVRYNIFMEFGLDLCFTSDYYPYQVYSKKYTFKELKNRDIKDYWWLQANYQDNDYVKLCEEKLQSATTEFFLVIPDSINQTAEVLHLFNCNYSEE